MIPQEYSEDIRKVIKWSLILILILSLFLAILSVNALKKYGTIGRDIFPTKTISVTGTGEALATPDVAQFTFSVTEESDSVASAQEAVTGKIKTALDSLKELGVEDKDIKTAGYNAYPRYAYPEILCVSGNCPPRERILSGYEVSQTISVKVRDTAKAGEALSKVANAGVSNVSGLQFVIDDRDVFIAEARAEAILDAQDKINQLAANLGVRVKGVVGFSESPGGVGPQYDMALSSKSGIGGEGLALPDIPSGENKVQIQVFITYEIK